MTERVAALLLALLLALPVLAAALVVGFFAVCDLVKPSDEPEPYW